MVRMFVRHKVNDYAVWRKAYDDFDGERVGLGVKGHSVFQAADDPNDLTVCHDFETLDAAQSFAGSDRLKEVMKGAGVSSAPDIWFTNPT
ncbi:MAG: cyclase [SAR324 cluster bacterium]|nr:cyclase [SAR324 cluster bacterium]